MWSTEWDGLVRFRRDPSLKCWQNWRSWPHLVLTLDRGSDNFAAGHALLYKSQVQLNCSLMWGPSHDAWRAVLDSFTKSGLNGFVWLIMIAINLPHGPDDTDMRWAQMRKAAQQLFQLHNYRDMALFQEYSRDMMIKSLVSYGLLELDPEGDPEQVLWDYLKKQDYFARKGYKCNRNRFQSVVRDGLALLKMWYPRLFVMEYTALEMDMLKSKKNAQKLLLQIKGADTHAPAGSTKAKGVDERTLRSCAQNSLVVTVRIMSENTSDCCSSWSQPRSRSPIGTGTRTRNFGMLTVRVRG